MKGFIASPIGFHEDFLQATLRTVRLVRLFGDSDLAMRPAPGMMSLSEQCNHICASNGFIRALLEEESPTTDAFHCVHDTSTIEAVVASMKSMAVHIRLACAKITHERWMQKVTPFGPDWRLSRGQHCYMMLDHESHHRGQITVYARLAGKVPPTLYAPASEQLLEPYASI